MPGQDFRIDKTILGGGQVTGESRQCAREREARELVREYVKTERTHPIFVRTDSLQGAAERRAQQEAQESERQQQQNQYDVVHLNRLGQIERFKCADRRRRLEVHVAAVGTAADLGIVENEIEH